MLGTVEGKEKRVGRHRKSCSKKCEEERVCEEKRSMRKKRFVKA